MYCQKNANYLGQPEAVKVIKNRSVYMSEFGHIIVPFKVTKYRRTKTFKSAVRVRVSVVRVLGLVLGLV